MPPADPAQRPSDHAIQVAIDQIVTMPIDEQRAFLIGYLKFCLDMIVRCCCQLLACILERHIE